MKTIEIDKKIDAFLFENQIPLEIVIDEFLCKELICGLLLIRECLDDVLHLKFSNFSFFLKLGTGSGSTTTLISLKDEVFKGLISMNNLEYALYYLLKYYRDGIGEADHIDIDIDFIGLDKQEVTITLTVNNYKDYTSKQAREMLG